MADRKTGGIMKVLGKTYLWRGLVAVLALIFALSLMLTYLGWYYEGFVNVFFDIVPESSSDGEDVYTSAYGELSSENSETLIEAENDFNIRAMQEGAVMLKNEDCALPLTSDEMSVTLFGNSVKDPVYATNGGGSSFKSARGGSLYDAFTSAGFEINDTLFSAYENSGVSRVSSSTSGSSDIGEVGQDFYTSALQASYADSYNDVAIVLFTRYGGEGVDLEYESDVDGVPLLSLHEEEEDLLLMIQDSGKFDKTVVLINSPFPMDIGWLDEEQYGVDACLAFGAAGDVGFIGVANLLVGNADPSGHLTDTYATDSQSSPAMQNFGDYTFTNHSTQYERNYVVYAEDIYVGYKYYETRYHDQVLGINNATGDYGVRAGDGSWDYADEMGYTFGYGLSYAEFEQELVSLEWDREAGEVTAEVKVTNNGPAEGSSYGGESKSVVQLYASAPYEEGQAEKPAIQMIGFAKTSELAAGESETVEVVADDYLFASYDETATNGADATKTGCYVFDAGDYVFSIGDDSHDALNNAMAARYGSEVSGSLFDEAGNTVEGDAGKAETVTLSSYDNETYAASEATGETVSNQFDDADYNYFADGTVTFLTRSDWSTFPVSYDSLSTTTELDTLLDGNTYETPSDSPSVDSFTTGADNGIEFVEMKDVEYDDDETWELFLDQLSITDLATIMGETMGNAKISSVNKPANVSQDGPKGLGSSYNYGNGEGITLYVDEVVMSSTWNLDLLRERGELFAEDALYAGYSMIYGPGANWHRTPYSGRNSEYYSEDANMSYICGAEQVAAMQAGGLVASIKHFAANDQETNRHGIATFMCEQGFRQGSLRCFEGALRDDVGGGLGTMTSFNRIGAVADAASEALLTQVLRNEWGFKGVNLTDSSKDASDYVHTEECVVAGTDMFNNDSGRTTELSKLVRTNKDGTILQAMRSANKHFYYAMSRSNLVNGLEVGVAVADFTPWWQIALIALDVSFGVLTVAALAVGVTGYVLNSREKEGD